MNTDDSGESAGENMIVQPLIQKANYCQGMTKKNHRCGCKVTEGQSYCKRHEGIFRFEKPTECPICVESLEGIPQALSCGHWICRSCIFKWGKAECPVCRAAIKLTKAENRQLKVQKVHPDNENNELSRQFIESIISELSSNEDHQGNITVFEFEIPGRLEEENEGEVRGLDENIGKLSDLIVWQVIQYMTRTVSDQ